MSKEADVAGKFVQQHGRAPTPEEYPTIQVRASQLRAYERQRTATLLFFAAGGALVIAGAAGAFSFSVSQPFTESSDGAASARRDTVPQTTAPYYPPQTAPTLTIPTQPFQTFDVPNNQALVDQINAQIQEAASYVPETFAPQGQYAYPSPTKGIAGQLALFPRPGDDVCDYFTPSGEIVVHDVNGYPHSIDFADYVRDVNRDQTGISILGFRQDGSAMTLRADNNADFKQVCP